MNFESGTTLAVFQDALFKQWIDGNHIIDDKIRSRLNGNLWVSVASYTAPNNLVIRHRCLQDMFNGDVASLGDILRLFNILAPGLWLESYSYWRYVKDILSTWGNLYYPVILDAIKKVDENFVSTAYIGADNDLYPAPFGDLRRVPLEDSLQSGKPVDQIDMKPIIKQKLTYTVKACPLGENMHVPIKNCVIQIKNGVPDGFQWYEGYNKKYKNGFEEFKDALNPKRIFSIFKFL